MHKEMKKAEHTEVATYTAMNQFRVIHLHEQLQLESPWYGQPCPRALLISLGCDPRVRVTGKPLAECSSSFGSSQCFTTTNSRAHSHHGSGTAAVVAYRPNLRL